MMQNYVLRYLCLVVYCVFRTIGDQNEYKLVNDLLRRYDKRIRPSRNATLALNVTFGLALSQIIDVNAMMYCFTSWRSKGLLTREKFFVAIIDEKNQILTTNCWLNQVWTDYGLRWNPKKYGGIKVVRLPYDAVWRPDIFLYNNADVSTLFSSISSNVIVSSDGNVTWLSMVIFKSSCSINVRYFPFDEQNCSMTFASWTYDGFQLNLLLTTNDGDISNYIPNSEWTLMKLYVEKKVMYYSCCDEPYPDITYYIYIRRRPLFYIFNMVLPCILITLVALLGFYIPSDSGEKVTMGITTLLSMTVFMMLVAENMPPTSDVLPLIGIYYGITICIVSIATGMTVFTLNIHHKGQRGPEVPHILKKIFFGVFAKILCLRIDVPDVPLSKVTYTPDVTKRSSGSTPLKLTSTSCVDTPKRRLERPNTCLDQHPINRYQVNIENVRSHSNGSIPTNSGQGMNSFSTEISGNVQSDPLFEQNLSKVMNKVYKAIENNETRLAIQEKRNAIKLEWQQVALVVDRILLSLFVTVTVVMTSAILIQGPVAQS